VLLYQQPTVICWSVAKQAWAVPMKGRHENLHHAERNPAPKPFETGHIGPARQRKDAKAKSPLKILFGKTQKALT
jgi:hypothetical protein